MHIELKKLKTHEDMSDETLCFSAEIWVDGRLLARVRNEGRGGSNNYDFNLTTDGTRWKEFSDWCKAQPPHVSQGYTIPCDTDLVIYDLIGKHERRKQLRRWCKNQTLYRLKGDKEGEWRVIKSPYFPSIERELNTKYGDKLESIANNLI